MAVQQRITIEDFIALVESNPDRHFELTATGEVIEVSPKRLHGVLQAWLARIFIEYKLAGNLVGYQIMTECLYNLPGFPCQPDVSIDNATDEDIPTVAPLLAVEIKSDSNTLKDLRARARKFIAAGTKMVWLVLPNPQVIDIYQPDADDIVLGIDDAIDGGSVLPGFTLAVRTLFGA